MMSAIRISKNGSLLPWCKGRFLTDSAERHIKHLGPRGAFMVAILFSMIGSGTSFAGSGDGPRSFPLLPKDINLLTVYAMGQNGNQLLDPGQTIPDADQ